MNELLLPDVAFVNSVPRFVIPILLAALGGALCERAGVFNIALEGMMLIGAFVAVVVSQAAGSSLVATLGAMLAGMAVGGLFAFVHLRYRADAIVVSIAIILLAQGLTATYMRGVLGVAGVYDDPAIVGLYKMDLGAAVHLPVVGPLLHNQTVLVLLAPALVVFTHWFLARHWMGLRLRGVGEDPVAARALGTNVTWTKACALLACGALCGLAGTQLSLGNVTLFVENMVAGRGWIAVVVVLVTRGRPMGVLAVALLFGMVDSYSFRLQGLGLPQQFTDMFPYVVTLAILVGVSWQRHRKNPTVV